MSRKVRFSHFFICANVVLAGAAASACAPSDVVIAEVAPDGGANSDGAAQNYGTPCKTSNDCATDDFCEKNNCGAVNGYCHHVPDFCDPSRDAVCGCDGVTYWNDCLRKQNAVAAAVAGECESGTSCSAGTDCPGTGASCARLLAPDRSCPSGATGGSTPDGVCWHLPPQCPAGDTGDPAAFVPCDGMPASCQTICETIRAEKPAIVNESCAGDH